MFGGCSLGQPARKTHLHGFHSSRGRMVSFAGFEMPMWYKGIIPEHMAVRNAVGIFDVTHMGRVLISGPEAEAFLDYVTTNNVAALPPLSAHYSTMCNELGGIKDDFILSRLEPKKFLIVPNAINRAKDYEWLVKQSQAFDVKIEDVSDNIAMFAVQGPKAEQTLQEICDEDLSKIPRFKGGWAKLAGVEVYVSRTGYTGEDGFELFVWNVPLSNPDKAIKVWSAVLEAGRDVGIEPCGLGARDTLRLEAGMCLYGNDIDENTTPLEAGLGFVVKFKKRNFIGKEALLKQKTEGLKRKRVGVRMLERGIPRPHHEVWKNEEKIGHVTSGTFSPILKRGIAMAYLSTEYAMESTTVDVRIRDKFVKGEVVRFPFYDVTQYGYRRET
ncbi:MAG: glycine cleavage system aminomethyltransferase GcvT [Candidatus Bathyarchaeia archaeon]